MSTKRAEKKTPKPPIDEHELAALALRYGWLAQTVAAVQDTPKRTFQVLLDGRQVHALRIMRMMSGESTQPVIRRAIADVIQQFFAGTREESLARVRRVA